MPGAPWPLFRGAVDWHAASTQGEEGVLSRCCTELFEEGEKFLTPDNPRMTTLSSPLLSYRLVGHNTEQPRGNMDLLKEWTRKTFHSFKQKFDACTEVLIR